MLSSQTGAALSGTGAGKSAVVLGAGLRPGLVRSAPAGMLGGSAAARGGVRPGSSGGLGPLQAGGMLAGLGIGMPGRFDPDKEGPPHGCSGSDADSDSGDEEEQPGPLGDTRRSGGVKRERAEMEAALGVQEAGLPAAGFGVLAGGVAGAKPGKKTRGRVKIKMEFIDNKLRRYTTFSKRKTGIMKKAYELSTLTGTQVLLLVASETGHVYTFATRKLQPMITSETGKALIQTCLNSPDSPPRSDCSDQRMSASGYEETELTYQVSESESLGEGKDSLKPVFTVSSLPGSTNTSAPPTSSSSTSYPISSYSSTNGSILKSTAPPAGVMLPSAFTFMPGSPFAPGAPALPLAQLQPHTLALQNSAQPISASCSPTPAQQQQQQTVFRLPASVTLTGGAMPQQLQTLQVQSSSQSSSSISSSDSSSEISQSSTAATSTATVSLPAAAIVSSSMMYPNTHTVMYTSSPALADGGLLLNAFTHTQGGMQVAHTQSTDTGAVSQVFLTAPPGTVQIPMSAVQLHPMVIGQQSSGSSNSLTELQVVNLDTHNAKTD
ncbi:serum response factor b isoform X2 [Danio aesculapii]|uniref:serum response factor b isoform X2 n=1 Tax=Danio aesculapii TaxID=1142201 RepID=UPI0024C05550|nr:serum response factor b isoform X2 [Danio aesculapii]